MAHRSDWKLKRFGLTHQEVAHAQRFTQWRLQQQQREAREKREAKKHAEHLNGTDYKTPAVDFHTTRENFLKNVRHFPSVRNAKQLRKLLDAPGVKVIHRQRAAQLLLEWSAGNFHNQHGGKKIQAAVSAYDKGPKNGRTKRR